jgi:5-methylcytosine-specific restriction endonuclease McrBC regulatory subunit McrC
MVVDDQAPVYLRHVQKVLMRPGIVASEGGTVVLVADCKYKRLEPDEFKNHDMYQMLAYCTATRVQRALLIYPLHAALIEDEVEIRNTHTVIQQIAIDLSKGEMAELNRECDAFVGAVLARFRATKVGQPSYPDTVDTEYISPLE